MVEHTEHKLVRSMCIDPPPSGAMQTSHGRRGLPTRYKIKYAGNRWYRVYAIGYGNAKSAVINYEHRIVFIDDETAYRLEELSQ